MEASSLNHPREAGQLSPDSSVGVEANGAINGASDAETRYDDAWYEEVARHLDSGGFCLCVKCLGSYCFGTKASADRLVSAMTRRKGIAPLKIPHTGV